MSYAGYSYNPLYIGLSVGQQAYSDPTIQAYANQADENWYTQNGGTLTDGSTAASTNGGGGSSGGASGGGGSLGGGSSSGGGSNPLAGLEQALGKLLNPTATPTTTPTATATGAPASTATTLQSLLPILLIGGVVIFVIVQRKK
jgi:hypothetical protein